MAKRVSVYYCGMWYTINVPLDAREERERGEVGGRGGSLGDKPLIIFLGKKKKLK